MVEQTRAAGGIFVADEVQAGHGRLGGELWAFARYGLAPDVVTLGKPMGNGYPVAAVVARGDLVERFAAHGASSAPSAETRSRPRRPSRCST